MNKKGLLGMSVKTLLELTIIGALMVLTFALFFPLLGQDADTASAELSLGNLAYRIQEMVVDPQPYLNAFADYTIEGSYLLVGFDTDADETVIHRDEGPVAIPKPDTCSGMGCLCLFEDPMENLDPVLFPKFRRDPTEYGKIFKCNKFSERSYGKIIFLGHHIGITAFVGDDSGIVLNPEDEVEYQKLSVLFNTNERTDEGTFYVERIYVQEDPSISYVIVTLDPRLERRKHIYQLCPQGSQKACSGKPYDKVIRESNEEYYCFYVEDLQTCKAKALVNECDQTNGVNAVTTCICGDYAMYDRKVCSNNQIYDVDCSEIVECDDYCTAISTCGILGIDMCRADPCKLGCSVGQFHGEDHSCS